MPTLFTKIIKRAIPSYQIYEDKTTFAFLDIAPKARGHVLVVPKGKEIPDFEALPVPTYLALMQTSRFLAQVLKRTFAVPKVALLIEGLEIPHAHVHLIPIHRHQDLQGSSLSLSAEEMKTIQIQITNNL